MRREANEGIDQTMLASVVEGAPIALAVCDASGRTVLANERCRLLLGDGFEVRALLESDPTALDRALAGATVRTRHEWRHAADTGTRVAVRVTLTPVVGAGGTIEHVTAAFEDVTAAVELAEERTRLNALLERGADIFYLLTILRSLTEGVIATDRGGIIVRMNPAAEHLTGWEAAQAEGRPLEEVVLLRAAGDVPISGLAELALTGEERSDGGSWVELVDHDGARIPAGFHVSPLRTREGNVEGALVVLRDMTETRRAQAELRESRQFLEEAQAVAHIGSWVSEVARDDGLVWSRETYRIFGIEEGDFDGRVQTFFDHVHPEDLAAIEAAAEAAWRGDAKYEVTHRIVRPDGAIRWVYQQATVYRDRDGAPLRMVGTAQDITERKEAEEQLMHAQKLEAVGRLAGGIAHDFNNLMSVVLSFADILLAKLHEGDRLRPHVEQIRLAGERATHLTRQLLAFGRRQMMQPRVVDLDMLVSGMIAMVRRVIGEDIELELRPSAGRLLVFVDPTQIEQVVLNLTLNARDAMPEGGRLTIELGSFDISDEEAHHFQVRAGPYAMLAVSDTGQGMDAETLSRAFEPYFTTKKAGTGLGLASVHGIVRQSGGTILVNSEPGHGTTFAIYLPARDVDVATEEPSESAPSEPPPRPRAPNEGTILLVEDDPQVREVARVTLEAAGFHVLSADAPSTALAIARKRDGVIDLLLTDVVLPEMSGRKLADALTAERAGLPVLYMSGYAQEAIGQHGVLNASVALVEKPITPAMLLSRVRSMLSR